MSRYPPNLAYRIAIESLEFESLELEFLVVVGAHMVPGINFCASSLGLATYGGIAAILFSRSFSSACRMISSLGRFLPRAFQLI